MLDSLASRPLSPRISEGQSNFVTPMLDAASLWQKMNNGDAPDGVGLPLVLAVVFLAVAYAFAQLPPIGRRPVFGYMSSFAIVIGGAFLVPAIMWGLARAGRTFLRRQLGVEGLLAHANLTSAIPRLSISVAALAVSLSMMVAIAVMIGVLVTGLFEYNLGDSEVLLMFLAVVALGYTAAEKTEEYST